MYLLKTYVIYFIDADYMLGSIRNCGKEVVQYRVYK